MTREVANSSGSPTWGISDATFEACARLAVWDLLHLGIPLKRATREDPTGHLGHNEVIDLFDQGYETACPLNLYVDRILDEARALLASPAGLDIITIEEDTMNKPFGIKLTVDTGTKYALISGDLSRMIPLWYTETANALAEVFGDFIEVQAADWAEFESAAGK
jgi:hypothetical protein